MLFINSAPMNHFQRLIAQISDIQCNKYNCMRQENQPETFCPKCNRFIRTQNFLIHDARCRGSTGENPRPSTSQLNKGQSRVYSSRMRPQEDQQKIPCPFCGYGQTLLQLDTHPNQCQHRQVQCEYCKSMFPKTLMDQHMMVCSSRRRRHQHEQQQSPMRRGMQQAPRGGGFRIIFGNPNQRNDERSRDPFFEMMMRNNPMQRRSPMRDFETLINILALLQAQQQQANGLSEEEMKEFKVTKYVKKNEEGDLCTICYCNFEEGEEALELPCKHIYHPECIKTWLDKNDKCPVCKQCVRKASMRRSPDRRRQPMPFGMFMD